MAFVKGPSRVFLARYRGGLTVPAPRSAQVSGERPAQIEITPFTVKTAFSFGKKQDQVSPILLKRVEKIAVGVLDRYEKICAEEIIRLNKKIVKIWGQARIKAGMQHDLKKKEAILKKAKKQCDDIASTTVVMVKNAAASIQGAIDAEVSKTLKKDKNFGEILTEFKVAVAYRIGKGVVKFAVSIVELVASGGVDPMAWKNMATSLVAIGKAVADLTKSEKKIKADMFKAMETYAAAKVKEEDIQMKAASEKSWKSFIKKHAKSMWNRLSKKAKAAEASRKRYDVFIGKFMKSVDKQAIELERQIVSLKKWLNSLRGPAIVKNGRKVLDQTNVMKRQILDLVTALEGRMAFADSVAVYLTEAGVKVDRRSFRNKLREGAGLKDMLMVAKDVQGTVKTIKKGVDLLVSL